jgi:hypothetical protein
VTSSWAGAVNARRAACGPPPPTSTKGADHKCKSKLQVKSHRVGRADGGSPASQRSPRPHPLDGNLLRFTHQDTQSRQAGARTSKSASWQGATAGSRPVQWGSGAPSSPAAGWAVCCSAFCHLGARDVGQRQRAGGGAAARGALHMEGRIKWWELRALPPSTDALRSTDALIGGAAGPLAGGARVPAAAPGREPNPQRAEGPRGRRTDDCGGSRGRQSRAPPLRTCSPTGRVPQGQARARRRATRGRRARGGSARRARARP